MSRRVSRSSGASSSAASSRRPAVDTSEAKDDEELEIVDDLQNPEEAGGKLFRFDAGLETIPKRAIKVPEPSKKDGEAWEKMADEAQKVCVREIVRLFLMKGGRKEAVTRKNISDALGAVDEQYKKCLNSVVQEVQLEMKKCFGYALTVINDQQQDDKNKKKDADYYLFNIVRSPKLQEILAETSASNSAWLGFVFVVLQSINTSPGKSIDSSRLLRNIRELDPRFPETATTAVSDSVPVPELGADFASLMKRMQKEKYVVMEKEEAKGEGEHNRISYKFGPRYYAELGRQQIITSYYKVLGQQIDKNLLSEAIREEREANGSDDEEEGADAGAQEQAEAQAQEAPQPERLERAGSGRARKQKRIPDEADEDEEEAELEDSPPRRAKRGRGRA